MAITFSSAAAIAGTVNFDDEEDEPGEEIQSSPNLEVGEEREIFRGTGMRKKLLKKGQSWQTPSVGDEATVHYVGSLLDGTEFESTRSKGGPVVLKLGTSFHPGLDRAILTMKMGECALFTLPPSSECNGVVGSSVPPKSVVIFEVELISWISVINVTKDGGIVKRILVRGDGGSCPGDLDQVNVKFSTKLPDGTVVVEKSSEAEIEFYLNDGLFNPVMLPSIIRTMVKGEKASVTIQPKYARDVIPDIPSNTTLTIDLELLSFKHVADVSGDMMVVKKIMKKGEEGSCRPEDGLSVWIKSTGKLEDGTVFERFGFDVEGGFQFVLGEEQVITGLDIAAATMAKGEISLLTIKPKYGYGENEFKGNLATVPSHSTLIFEIEMIDFTKGKEPWTMNVQERLEAVDALKECGNSLFKIGKYQRAFKKYSKALYYMDEEESIEDTEAKQFKPLKVSCLLNSAACNLKLNDFHHAINSCSYVLGMEFHNVKALYRRAQAFIETSDLDMAIDIKTSRLLNFLSLLFLSMAAHLSLFFFIFFFSSSSWMIAVVESFSTITHLPGFDGPLPFHLETGYVSLNGNDNIHIHLFYYFFKSESNPSEDPLTVWLTGGPGCSSLTGWAFENGPLTFKREEFNGSVPTLLLNPYSWTMTSNLLYVDSPVGTGFSFSSSSTSQIATCSDTSSINHLYNFLPKWFAEHPEMLSNPLYIAGDSYAGKIVPILAHKISQADDDGPVLNLKGYMIGNPVTGEAIESTSRLTHAHNLCLISHEFFKSSTHNCQGQALDNPNTLECAAEAEEFDKLVGLEINLNHILEPKCLDDTGEIIILPNTNTNIRSLEEEEADIFPRAPPLQCRSYGYYLGYQWANMAITQEALHVQKGSIGLWDRCNKEMKKSYITDIPTSTAYHFELINQGYQILIYSGDHDLIMPVVGTEEWIRSLNLPIKDKWRSWKVDDQVAGYTMTFDNNFTFATVKDGGHTALEYKPKECFSMFQRWVSNTPL